MVAAEPMSASVECAVCGAAVETGGRPGLSFMGRQWWFCGQACRLAFKREPEHWAKARPEAGRAVGTGQVAAPPRTRTPSVFKVRAGREP